MRRDTAPARRARTGERDAAGPSHATDRVAWRRSVGGDPGASGEDTDDPADSADASNRGRVRSALPGVDWSRARAQTEPLAALVAVSFVAIAVGIYALYLADVLPGQSDDALEGPVADQVWDDLQQAGAYPNETDPADPGRDRVDYPEHAIDTGTIPAATNVYVVVTTTDDSGHDLVVGEVHFGPDGTVVDPPEGPPPDARTEIRSIPVEMGPGEVRSGTLRVEVW